MTQQTTTIGRYLAERLKQIGARHVFGVPGDYVLTFMDRLIEADIDLVDTCNELNAGYAADGYARINGIGAVCVTYGVGGFSALNAVAGAYAEQSPLVVISGSPAMALRGSSIMLHHSAGDLRAQMSIYEHVTVASVQLGDPATAPEQIDATLAACLTQKRPVMIEIPADMVDRECAAPGPFEVPEPQSDPDALSEALDEIGTLLASAERPVILAGVELHRFGLLDAFETLVHMTGLPVATTLLAKTVISERDPHAVGVYEGAASSAEVRRLVEGADVLLSLGAWMSDVSLGVYAARLNHPPVVNANSGRVRVRHHYYEPVMLGDLVRGLNARLKGATLAKTEFTPVSERLASDQTVEADRKLSVKRLFGRINQLLTEDTIVVADVGDALYGAADLVMHRDIGFLGQAFYLSIGNGLPATLGAQMAAPDRPVLAIIGDGAFQMTAQDFSTIARRKLTSTILLLNNDGYTTERLIHEGPYNDIPAWNYHKLPEVVGGGLGLRVRTEGEFEAALEQAAAFTDGPTLIEIMLDPRDSSDALKRMCAELPTSTKKGG